MHVCARARVCVSVRACLCVCVCVFVCAAHRARPGAAVSSPQWACPAVPWPCTRGRGRSHLGSGLHCQRDHTWTRSAHTEASPKEGREGHYDKCLQIPLPQLCIAKLVIAVNRMCSGQTSWQMAKETKLKWECVSVQSIRVQHTEPPLLSKLSPLPPTLSIVLRGRSELSARESHLLRSSLLESPWHRRLYSSR